ncbi:MAG: PspC domain-containing protein [Acidimicrobiales bacterium]
MDDEDMNEEQNIPESESEDIDEQIDEFDPIDADDVTAEIHDSDTVDVTDEFGEPESFDGSAEVAADSDGGSGGDSLPPGPAENVAPPPQPMAGLVRDPYATFGGVLSGIAHRYGWDVAVTRLVFMVILLLSGGTALIAYLLAWLIIPRATYWPPGRSVAPRSGRFTSREIGIGVIGAGVLVALAIGGGGSASVLVPLALVGGGLYLLLQPQRDEAPVAPAAPPPSVPTAAMAGAAPLAPPSPPYQAASGFGAPTAPLMPPPMPVEKRSRGRRFALFALVGTGIVALLAIIAIPFIFLIAVTEGDIDFGSDRQISYIPSDVESIPRVVTERDGELVLDLTMLEPSDFEGVETPVEVVIDLDLGVIDVIVPPELRVDIDASAGLGDVTLFDRRSDGINPSRSIDVEDPHLHLELDAGLGEVHVQSHPAR